MTTTVWYGKEKILFSDKQMGKRKVTVCKIIPTYNGWIAGAGSYDVLQEVAQWAEANEGFGDGTRPPPQEWEDAALNTDILYVNSNGDAFMVTIPYLRAIPIKEDVWATGSGGDLAAGALAASGDIITAMSIAHRYDAGTGNEYDVMHLGRDPVSTYTVNV